MLCTHILLKTTINEKESNYVCHMSIQLLYKLQALNRIQILPYNDVSMLKYFSKHSNWQSQKQRYIIINQSEQPDLRYMSHAHVNISRGYYIHVVMLFLDVTSNNNICHLVLG